MSMFKTGAVSGMESLYRSMGLGPILDEAKKMHEQGVFQKILNFADQSETLIARQAELSLQVERLIMEVRELKETMRHERNIASDPGSANGDDAGRFSGERTRLLRSADGLGPSGAARGAVDGGSQAAE